MHANAASKLASVVETDLNRRFSILSLKLQARSGAASGLTSTSGQASLSSYLPQHTRPPASAAVAVDVKDVFRALSRVDMARKPAQVGDAARRAAHEAPRVPRTDASIATTKAAAGDALLPARRGSLPSAGERLADVGRRATDRRLRARAMRLGGGSGASPAPVALPRVPVSLRPAL